MPPFCSAKQSHFSNFGCMRAIGGILLCKYFEIRPLAKDEMSFEDFLIFSSGGHLGFLFYTILACFDPEVILLLKSKFRLKAI